MKASLESTAQSPAIMRAVSGLVGCPVGGWAETTQARRRLIDELPWRAERTYSVDDVIAEYLEIDHACRYQLRAVVTDEETDR